ncbi:hypothetical protein D3C87_1203010 [compost metagenome]
MTGRLLLAPWNDAHDARRGAEQSRRRGAAGDGDLGSRNLTPDLANRARGHDAVADPVRGDEQDLGRAAAHAEPSDG